MVGREDIGVDLGTATVMIYVKGRGVVFREAAMVAVDLNNGNILAVGEDAKRMQGRTPKHIAVVRPLKDGSISDIDLTTRMLRYCLRMVTGKRMLLRPHVLLSVPSTVKDMERHSVTNAMLDAGARRVQTIDSAVAAALGAGVSTEEVLGSLVVDMGGGITDIAVVSQDRVPLRNACPIAGDYFDETIIRFLRRKHNLMVGARTAEEIKTTIGAAVLRTEQLYMDVTGRSLVTGLPKTMRISADEICEALEEPIGKLVEEIHAVLERTPPELAADIFDNGITLTGGSAQLFGLAEHLSRQLKIDCRLADEAQDSVARGVGLAMESGAQYGRAIQDIRRIRGYLSA
ncbi:MAG: rod shape-determining protein [Oscillospiraceae bacterium]|jgi:rod shape-determining protein MreB|nr:rod shape-determining protein [Oscillospiraceae bacterium]